MAAPVRRARRDPRRQLIADDAILTLIPRSAGKSPPVFAVHRLTIDSLGDGTSMPFEATITNPIPKGFVHAKGSFGPWRKDDPGGTPLSGRYTFDDVDLSTVKGITGNLVDRQVPRSARSDRRQRRNANPGFPPERQRQPGAAPNEVRRGRQRHRRRHISEQRIRDLSPHLAHREGSDCRRRGREGAHGAGARRQIDERPHRGRAAARRQGDQPAMTGRLDHRGDLNLPAGPADVMDRLELSGEFDVDAARFTTAACRRRSRT